MTPRERVLAGCAFKHPDRIPRWDSFWEYPATWRARLGPPEGLTDVMIWVPDETTFPTRARHIKQDNGWIYEVEGWGRTIRRRPDAYFVETLAVPLPAGVDIDSVDFDSPHLEARYMREHRDQAGLEREIEEAKRRHCVFGKTGGPFLRSTFVRGEAQFLTDIAADPPLARAIADKMCDHLTAIGVEQIGRWSLQDTGICIYDDMAYNDGPFVSPASFEAVFLPAYRRMIKAYRAAGAKYVLLHSDGDIRLLLDMLVDAGVDGINPVERRAHMDMSDIRKRFPRLILTGGMCNSDTLIRGPIARIEAEAREIIDLGRGGGVIIGTHSISPEVPLEHFEAYHRLCLTYGDFRGGGWKRR
jgi:uroporphyrinogen-III decarboxylase